MEAIIPLDASLLRSFISNQPGGITSKVYSSSLFGLAPGRVFRALLIAQKAVSPYLAFSPLLALVPRGYQSERYIFCGTIRDSFITKESPAVSRYRYFVEPGLSSRYC